MKKYLLKVQNNKQLQNQDLLFKNASLSLVSIATICSEAIKKNILAFRDIDESRLNEFIYTEFLCFYIHLMVNTAELIGLTEFQKIKLRTYLEQTIASYATGYFSEEGSEDLKENFTDRFISTLHEKEEEYKKFSDLQDSAIIPEVHFLSLFSKLAQNITSLLDKKEEKENILLFAYEVSTKEWARMNPTELLLNIKQNS
jgi:hypothetical protein